MIIQWACRGAKSSLLRPTSFSLYAFWKPSVSFGFAVC